MMNRTADVTPGDDTLNDDLFSSDLFQTPPKTVLNPLSELPRDPDTPVGCLLTPGPADRVTLEKSSPSTPGVKLEKDPKPVMTDTLALIRYGVVNSTNQRLISDELRALLAHEKKLVEQMFERAMKFTKMKEENLKVMTEWEDEHKQRMPAYAQYLKQLMAIPESQVISQEGMPQAVQQKILYKIVENTNDVANNALVQMSMQKTLTEDIDMSLGKLKQFCVYLLTHVDEWLVTVTNQACDVRRIHLQWISLSEEARRIQERKAKKTIESVSGQPTCSVDDLANTLNRLCGNLEEIKKNVRVLEQRQTRIEGQTQSVNQPDQLGRKQSQQNVPPPRAEENVQGSPRIPAPSPSQHGGFPPGPSSSQHGGFPPARSPSQHGRFPPAPSPSQHGGFPFGEDHFRFPPSTPPPGFRPPATSTPTSACYGPDGRLIRRRAPPGQFPDVDLLDLPGMGFPIPRAAMEKQGRLPGTPLPITPPDPAPHDFDSFQPISASSPTGQVRQSQDFFTPVKEGPPKVEDPMDPRLLPKIQEGLKSLSQRNKKLQELVGNFRQMRELLTEEMDKAVRLNQKLQRDLYVIAQDQCTQPQKQ